MADTQPQGPSTRPMGAHMPTVGGLHNALTSGRDIGCTAVQLFTGNPRQWQPPALTDDAVAQFRQTLADTAMPFVVAHDSYLINLAAPDPKVMGASRRAMRDELVRADALGIGWVVTHMGAHLNTGEEAGLEALIGSVRRLLEETDGLASGIAMETTAGQGTGLGYLFEHLATVIEGSGGSPRLGVCLDTCHIFAAGYDIRDADCFKETLDRFDATIGLDRLKAIHVNDAKKPLGSRVDRHEHLGKGEVGEEAFRLLVNEPRLAAIPLVLETPESETMHKVNLEYLRGLQAT